MPSEFTPLSREPLPITVAGRRFFVPHRPAAQWAQGLAKLSVLAGALMDEADREDLGELVFAHPRAYADVREESLRILAEATGRKWFEAGRLIKTSVQPEALGRLTLAGVDPWTVSIGAWCAAVYALCVKGLDDKARLRLDFSLAVPPVGHEQEWDDGPGDDPAAVMAAVQRMMRRG